MDESDTEALRLNATGVQRTDMEKSTYYFPHDYNARNDPKLQAVLFRLKQEGKGVFWDIIEMLYEQGGRLPLDYENLAFSLRTDTAIVRSVIEDYNLFENDGEYFWSNSVNQRMNRRIDIREKRKAAAKARWEKKAQTSEQPPTENQDINANALLLECTSNAIKRKEKEIKGKEIKENNSTIKENFKAEALSDIKLEQGCMSCYISPEEYRALANEIFSDWEYANTPIEEWNFMHFLSVLRIKVSILKKKKANENNIEQRDSKRRSFEATATSAEDYEGPF